MSGIFRSAAMRCSASAMVRMCFSLSMTHGPAMRKSSPVPTGTFWMLKFFTFLLHHKGPAVASGSIRRRLLFDMVDDQHRHRALLLLQLHAQLVLDRVEEGDGAVGVR